MHPPHASGVQCCSPEFVERRRGRLVAFWRETAAAGVSQNALPKCHGDEALGMMRAHQRSGTEALAGFLPKAMIQRAGGRQQRLLHRFCRCLSLGEVHGLKEIDLRFEREAMIGD